LVGLHRIVGWLKAKKQGERLHQFHKRIASLYEDGKLDKNDNKPLDKIKNDITDAYAKGKISELHYNFINKRISDYENNGQAVNTSSSL